MVKNLQEIHREEVGEDEEEGMEGEAEVVELEEQEGMVVVTTEEMTEEMMEETKAVGQEEEVVLGEK